MAPEVPGYRLIELLSGVNGQSEVWRAVDRSGATVAVKVLVAARDDLRIRLLNEGRLLTDLGGRHRLLGCLEILTDPAALALEYAGPENLLDRIYPEGRDRQPVPLSPAEASRVLMAAAEAVDWLHRHGVIHRDVKPSNILLAPSGGVWLIDLGVAAHGEPPRGLPVGWIEEEVGSAGYAAPELLRDPSEARPAVDVYGLGATLYEATTGYLPFDFIDGETARRFRDRIAAGAMPVPVAQRGFVPPALASTIDRAVAARPDDRFHSVVEFSAALRSSLP